MNREDIILKYIDEHDGCNKTNVKDGCIKYVGDKTADKILKKLIQDEKVVCEIDKVNPQIHRLHINNETRSLIKTKNLILSRFEEQFNNQKYTMAQLTTGGWAVMPVNDTITINLKSVVMQNPTKRAAGY